MWMDLNSKDANALGAIHNEGAIFFSRRLFEWDKRTSSFNYSNGYNYVKFDKVSM